jgi:hypothetical protein
MTYLRKERAPMPITKARLDRMIDMIDSAWLKRRDSENGGFRREVQPRRQHWFLNEMSGFPFRTPAFCSVSRGRRRLGEKEYRAPSVTPGLHFAPELRNTNPKQFNEGAPQQPFNDPPEMPKENLWGGKPPIPIEHL